MIKCDADEHRPLRLDAAEPLFLQRKNANKSPRSVSHPKGGFYYWHGIW